jgi:transcriptional regulator with XRE-family HTH domain
MERRPGDELNGVIDLTARRDADVGLGPESAGEALRLLRYRAKLSRDDLATLVGVSAGAISNYENDVSAPSAVTLRRISRIMAEVLHRDSGELWDQFGALLDLQGREEA